MRNSPFLCVYHDCGQIVNTHFPTVEEYKHWQESAFQYGVKWAHLIDRESGKIVECDFAE